MSLFTIVKNKMFTFVIQINKHEFRAAIYSI